MGPQELLQIIIAARRAREDGVPVDAINADIQARTGAPDLAGLVKMWAEAANAEEDPTGAMAEYAQDEHGAFSDFGRSFAEGATFRLADELSGLGHALVPGGKGYTEARDESRERMDRLREVAPGASTMGEIAGGAAVPVAGTSGLFRAASPVARAVGRGAVAGATGGGLIGAGGAEGGAVDRVQGAVEGALTGGLFGGVAGGVAYPLVRGAGRAISRATGKQASSRGSRIATEMAEEAGVDPSIRARRSATKRGQAAVSRRHFQPLEQKFAEGIESEDLVRVLSDEDVAPHARKVLGEKPSVSRKPTFTEVQSIRERLSREVQSAKRAGDINRMKDAQAALERLDEVLEVAVPGYSEARAAYARVMAPQRAYDQGRKMFSKPAEEILEALESQPSPEAASAFRAGLLQRFTQKLEQRSTPSNGAIRAITEAGPEMETKLRSLFPDDQTFQSFMRFVRVERNYMKAAELLKRTVPWIAGGGVGVGIGQSLFN